MYKKNFIKKPKVLKYFDQKQIGSLPRIFISSLLVVFFFYSMPLIVEFKNNKNNAFKNNSKAVLAYTLNNESGSGESNQKILNEKDLLVDIFSLNDLETDTVRLNASTIKQLFEDTNYTLNDVRKTKLVKPVALTLLPNEIKMIESTTKRKEFFIQIVLPLILKENNNIRLDRKRLFSIINKNNNTDLEKKWLDKKYKQYGIPSKDLSVLKIRMDEIPYCLNFFSNHFISSFVLLLLLIIVKSLFRSNLILLFSFKIKGKTICIKNSFLFLVFSIIFIS